jgi:hypothetical protein
MIVTMPSMKSVFQNTIRRTFPFLKMEINSSVTCYKVKPSECSRPSNEKWDEEESDCDEYNGIDELFSLANKSKIDALVSEHYSTING